MGRLEMEDEKLERKIEGTWDQMVASLFVKY